MKKLLILLSILIFIICDKKFNEKLDNKRRKISKDWRKNHRCMKACPRGYYVTKNCGCSKICENGYDSKGNCKKKKSCPKGSYYSSFHKRCCSILGRTCSKYIRPKMPERKPKKIDN